MAEQTSSSGRIDPFIAQDPNVPRYNQRLSQQQWTDLEPLISALHRQGTPQYEILEAISQRNISITKSQLHHQMMKWGLRTYKRNATDTQDVTTRETSSCQGEVESILPAGSVEIGRPIALDYPIDSQPGPLCGVVMSLESPSLPSDSTMTDSATSVEDMPLSREQMASMELVKPVSLLEGAERLRIQLPRYRMDSRVAVILSLYDNKRKQDSLPVRVEKLSRAATVLFVLNCHELSFDFFYAMLSKLNDVETQCPLSRLWLANSVINCARFCRTGPQSQVAEFILPQLWLWLQQHTLFDRMELLKELQYQSLLAELRFPTSFKGRFEIWAANAMPIYFGCTTGVQYQQEFKFSEATPKQMLDHCLECADLKDTLAKTLCVIQNFAMDNRSLLDAYLRRAFHDRRAKNTSLCLGIIERINQYLPDCSRSIKRCCFNKATSPIFYHVTYAIPAMVADVAGTWVSPRASSIEVLLAILEQYQRECFSPERDQYQLIVRCYMSHWFPDEDISWSDPEMNSSIIERVSVLSGLLLGEEVKSPTDSSPYLADPESFASERRIATDFVQALYPRLVRSGEEKLLPPIAPSCTSSLSSGFRSFKEFSRRFGSFRRTSVRSGVFESSEVIASSNMDWTFENVSKNTMESLVVGMDDRMEL